MQVKATHFIDTSILASIALDDRNEKECLRYLKRIPPIYKGNISLLVLGELYLSLLDNINDNISRTGAFQNISGVIDHLNLEFVTLEIPHYNHCIGKIKKADSRLEITDTKLLAGALGSECTAFITIDEKILESRKISELIRTVHPLDVI
ncbi:MAG: PIN domain-containing protein [Methanobacterium sp.]|nr:PIN domain-containing protein [Methanobacterium sp.]